eukprot:UN03574
MSIAKKGDRNAVDALIPRLADDVQLVADAACAALLRIADKEDPLAIDSLVTRLEDQESMYSRMYAAHALPCLAESSNQRIIEALAIGQRDGNSAVRDSAKAGHQVLTRGGMRLLEVLGPVFCTSRLGGPTGCSAGPGADRHERRPAND